MYNHLTLVGNLGRDPEMSHTPSGQAVTKFSVAVSRRWTDAQTKEQKEHTDWFNCVAWRQLAETCNTYLHKGSKVLVAGRMESRKYTDRDGVERTAWDVVLSDMAMLDPKQRDDTSEAGELGAGDDIPF
jgi:single-strand DNA-binding protein